LRREAFLISRTSCFGETRMQLDPRCCRLWAVRLMHSLSVVRLLTVAIAFGLVAAVLIPSTASWASAATCQRVETPNVGSGVDELRRVAVTSSANAWAVGYYRNVNPLGPFQALIEHWNGKAWKVQASPQPGSINDQLNGVAAISSTNAWAVGSYQNGNPFAPYQTLIEHWNGKAWKVQASPHLGRLSGVAATSARNAWAVGVYDNGTGYEQALIEHWNGKAWKVQASSDMSGLMDVTATSSINAWAVGYYHNGAMLGALFEHWNGKTWKAQLRARSRRNGVAATSARNAWAVGGGVIEHWNGKAWKIQARSSVYFPELNGVAATSTDAWAVGYANSARRYFSTLALHCG
jgi:hypothetical protein